MLGAIVSILWLVFLYNLIALAGCLFLGKFLFNSNILFLRILMNPTGTSKSITKAAGKAIRFAGWAAISGILLLLIY